MMDRFTSILAVYDDAVGSDDVLVQSIVLARATGAQLTVARPMGEGAHSLAAIEEERRRLSRLMPWIEQEGIDCVETEVLVGAPHVEIVDQVVRRNHDLVIASAAAQRGIKNLFLGSTASHLMRKCPCAVWLKRPGCSERNPAILAAVDAPVDQPVDPINMKVLELGAALARAQDATLNVMHSWEVTGSEAEMLRSEIRDSTRRSILNRHRAKRRNALESLLARHREPSVSIETHLPRGAHQSNIVALADQLDVGLVVMGTTSRYGIPGLLIGNSVELVLDAVRCDVLAVKPDGFRTPLPVQHTEMLRAPQSVGSH